MIIRRFRSLALCLRNTGWKTTLVYKWDRIRTGLGWPASGMLELRPKGLPYPLWLRRGRSSDMEVYRAIFIQREFAAVQLEDPPRLILDLGANVGLAAAWFLNLFPAVRIVCVEPDPVNFEHCRRNLSPYGDRVILVQGAVWSHPCLLDIQSYPSGEGREWAVTVREARVPGAATIRAWDVPSLAALAGPVRSVDLLKVDIEGSERRLFDASSAAWLPMVRNICIELHGPDCDEVFERALKPWRYSLARSGELTICSGLTAAGGQRDNLAAEKRESLVGGGSPEPLQRGTAMV